MNRKSKKYEFKENIRGLSPWEEKDFIKFDYSYPIKETNKAILFKVKTLKNAIFVPKSALRVNRRANNKDYNRVYINKSFYTKKLINGGQKNGEVNDVNR